MLWGVPQMYRKRANSQNALFDVCKSYVFWFASMKNAGFTFIVSAGLPFVGTVSTFIYARSSKNSKTWFSDSVSLNFCFTPYHILLFVICLRVLTQLYINDIISPKISGGRTICHSAKNAVANVRSKAG